jgi:hypothetical protein
MPSIQQIKNKAAAEFRNRFVVHDCEQLNGHPCHLNNHREGLEDLLSHYIQVAWEGGVEERAYKGPTAKKYMEVGAQVERARLAESVKMLFGYYTGDMIRRADVLALTKTPEEI